MQIFPVYDTEPNKYKNCTQLIKTHCVKNVYNSIKINIDNA